MIKTGSIHGRFKETMAVDMYCTPIEASEGALSLMLAFLNCSVWRHAVSETNSVLFLLLIEKWGEFSMSW